MSAIDTETSGRAGAHLPVEPAGNAAHDADGASQDEPPAPQPSQAANGAAAPSAMPDGTAPVPQAPADAAGSAPQAEPAIAEAVPTGEPPPAQPVPPAHEIELKLLVDPDRLADFNEAPAIAAHARNLGIRKHLKAVYYDTPDQLLRKNGLSLRVRQSGQHFVQTVKADSGDDPLRRGEWQANVPSIAPDAGLAMPFVPVKLRDELMGQPLQPVFTTDVHRHQRLVDLPSATVEVSFDRGLITAGDRSEPVSEIELELKDGDPAAIYELALQISEHGAVRPSIRSKAARGFDLATGSPPAAKTVRKLDVDPYLPLDDAFAAILGSCLRDLLVSMPAAEDGRDPEGIHQVRVALRRLRSALDSLRSVVTSDTLELLRADAQWLAASMSAARTWDIFQGETLPAVAGSCASIAGFDAMGEHAEDRRLAAYADARKALADARSTRFVMRLGAWIEARGWRGNAGPENLPQLAEPAFSFARRILSVHHGKVLKRGRHFRELTPQKRHRLRLAVKKLRYVADFLLPLCTDRKSARQFTTRLAELQDELGAFNDMATTGSLLANLVAVSAEDSMAAAAIAGWQAHAMVGAEVRLRSAWRDFAKTRPPWAPPGMA
jgi:triphosphatase